MRGREPEWYGRFWSGRIKHSDLVNLIQEMAVNPERFFRSEDEQTELDLASSFGRCLQDPRGQAIVPRVRAAFRTIFYELINDASHSWLNGPAAPITRRLFALATHVFHGLEWTIIKLICQADCLSDRAAQETYQALLSLKVLTDRQASDEWWELEIQTSLHWRSVLLAYSDRAGWPAAIVAATLPPEKFDEPLFFEVLTGSRNRFDWSARVVTWLLIELPHLNWSPGLATRFRQWVEDNKPKNGP